MDSGYSGFPIDVPDFRPGAALFDTIPLVANTARLPFQYEVDTSIFYEFEDWMFKLTVFNITDEENWDVNNSGYGNGSIVSRMPSRAEITARKRF
jgi:hypothetical protein